jgi:hypothetical protein
MSHLKKVSPRIDSKLRCYNFVVRTELWSTNELSKFLQNSQNCHRKSNIFGNVVTLRIPFLDLPRKEIRCLVLLPSDLDRFDLQCCMVFKT